MHTRRTLLRTSALLTAALGSRASEAAPATGGNRLRIQRLSWAGLLVECGETTLFLDASIGAPTDVPLVARTPSRNAAISHHHGDHFDPAALKPALGEQGLLVCWKGVVPWLSAHPLRVQAVDLYQPVFISRGSADLVAFAVPAVDGLGSPQVSWVVDGGGRRIIHCGDTLWHGHFWDIGRAYGPFDLAFLPINGFRQSLGRYLDSGQPMSMTPEQAMDAAALLRARAVCPIHFGRKGDPSYLEVEGAEERLRSAAERRGLPLRPLAPGAWWSSESDPPDAGRNWSRT